MFFRYLRKMRCLESGTRKKEDAGEMPYEFYNRILNVFSAKEDVVSVIMTDV